MLLRAAALFIIAYMVYFTKIGQNLQGSYQKPTLLRKLVALYAFNTGVAEVRPCLRPQCSAHSQEYIPGHLVLPYCIKSFASV